jgi:hypothetical protein
LEALPAEDPGKQESTKFTHPCVERSILYNVGETAVSVECARECVLASTISCASFASPRLQEAAVLLAKTMDGRALSYDFSKSTDSDLGKSKNPGSWRCCSFSCLVFVPYMLALLTAHTTFCDRILILGPS